MSRVLIRGGWVLPMAGEREVIRDGSVLVEDQRIVAMFRCMFQRRPSTNEIRVAQEFLTKMKMTVASSKVRPASRPGERGKGRGAGKSGLAGPPPSGASPSGSGAGSGATR